MYIFVKSQEYSIQNKMFLPHQKRIPYQHDRFLPIWTNIPCHVTTLKTYYHALLAYKDKVMAHIHANE
jgi:hypothetical protein